MQEPLLESGKVSDLNGLDGKIDSLTFYRGNRAENSQHNAFGDQRGNSGRY